VCQVTNASSENKSTKVILLGKSVEGNEHELPRKKNIVVLAKRNFQKNNGYLKKTKSLNLAALYKSIILGVQRFPNS